MLTVADSDLLMDLTHYLDNVCGGVDIINFNLILPDEPDESRYNTARGYAQRLREQFDCLGDNAPEVVAEGGRVIISSMQEQS